MPTTLAISWDELDALVARLADEVGRDHDVVLAITRGGLVPAGMLAYRLDLREILVAGAVFYLPDGGTHPRPVIGHFPDAELLAGRRVLVIDEVWESGETMTEVLARVRAAGGRARLGGPPLQARPVPGRGPPGPLRGRGRRLGRLPVQGRAADAGILSGTSHPRTVRWIAAGPHGRTARSHPAPGAAA